MLKSSPWVRFGMAAGLYLLLMWGYTWLPTAQWYAAFLALVTSSMMAYWVSEASADTHARLVNNQSIEATSSSVSSEETACSASLEASILRLDSLKEELTHQYAQFGRDQSLINSNGLGSWHGNRNYRER
ncbi:MAG: hypothetical protein AB8B79_02435 [Granulosicoccus sp.]